VLGDLLFSNDQLCTHLIVTKGEDLRILQNLQIVLALGSSEIKNIVLWILSNLILNSREDMNSVVSSGILMNVAMCCRAPVRKVKKEAIHMLGNLIIKLGEVQELQLLRQLFQ